ncbi:MAG: TIR domain-containing protein, partial [Thiolinea sp.]
PLLEQRVNQYVGRSKPERLWKDNRLTGNQAFSPEIHQQLNTAACLVSCLSPGYFASEWCMRELTEFSQRIGTDTGRIFCVELDDLTLMRRPALTSHMLGYRFWQQDALSKRSYPLYPGETAYENLLIDLSKDIAATLKSGNSQPVIAAEMQTISIEIPKENALTVDQEIKQVLTSQSGAITRLQAREARLETMLSRLQEQYDLESRVEEQMRIQRVIDEKQLLLSEVKRQIVLEKYK